MHTDAKSRVIRTRRMVSQTMGGDWRPKASAERRRLVYPVVLTEWGACRNLNGAAH
jgi:hypothetical protein